MASPGAHMSTQRPQLVGGSVASTAGDAGVNGLADPAYWLIAPTTMIPSSSTLYGAETNGLYPEGAPEAFRRWGAVISKIINLESCEKSLSLVPGGV